MPDEAVLVADLSSNALLAVSGDDATAFLQGQLTNDVAALPMGEAQWNGWCSPKGRLLATFVLARRAANDYFLLLPAALAEPIAKRLRMFVLRSKVTVEDAGAAFRRYGVAGAGAVNVARQGVSGTVDAIACRLAEDRAVVFSPEALFPGAESPAAWEASLVHAGIPMVVAATQDAFVPQMANFELVGGVSFKKGCYPGQEIVARTQYRGILKRRMALVRGEGSTPSPGDALYSEAFGEQAAGHVANAVPTPGGFAALVVAQVDSLRRRDLRLGSLTGPALVFGELPYPVPGSESAG